MPTYDYRCDRCMAQFELWQSMKDDSLTVCPLTDGPPQCVAPGEGAVRKVFSSVGISFKGDGFYKNDHGANAAGRRSEKEKTKDKDKEKDKQPAGASSSSADSNGSGSASPSSSSSGGDTKGSSSSTSTSSSGDSKGSSSSDSSSTSSSSDSSD